MGSYLIKNSLELRSIYNDLNKVYNSVIDLYWSVISLNTGFNDIFTDRYDTQSGIDQSSSNYTFDSVNQLLKNPPLGNLVVTTLTWSCSMTNPSRAYVVIEIETVNTIQLGSDIIIQISSDNGLTYSSIVKLNVYQTIEISVYGKIYYIRGEITNLPVTNDKRIKTKVICSSVKDIKIRGIATGVDY